MFLIKKRISAEANADQLLYQTEKSSYQRFSIKVIFLNFAILMGKYLCEIIKNKYFEEHLRTAASEQTL